MILLRQMLQMLLIFLFTITVHISSPRAYASLSSVSNFGNTCATPAMPGNSAYLAKTAHGYILSNISMPCTPCTSDVASPNATCQDPNPANLTLCIRQSPMPNSTACMPITLKLPSNQSTQSQGIKVGLSNIYNALVFGSSPVASDEVATVYLTSYPSSSQLCLTMMTPFGLTPLTCKGVVDDKENQRYQPNCTPVLAPACYGSSRHTQSPFSFSGQAYECLIGSLDNIFFQKSTCGTVSSQPDSNILSSYFTFQNALRLSIGAVMVIYIMFFGLRLALGEEKTSLGSLSMSAIKLVLVIYFAIGLGPLQYVNNQIQSTNNGMIDVAKPLLAQSMTDFAQMVFNAGGAPGLCAFDLTKYDNGYNYYSLFDAIDCRIAYYLGMQTISSQLDGSEVAGSSSTASGQEWNWKSKSGSIPVKLGMTNTEFFGYFFMLFGLLMGGNFIMLIFALVFLIVFLGIVLHFISSFLICVLTLYVMIYISPIFITFALFNRTKGYFESWLKISVSCALQPAILAGFLALVITMFDSGMYNKCQFKRHTYEVAATDTNSTSYVSTFGLVVPASGDDASSCTSSVGYKLMRYYQGDGWDNFGLLLFTIHFIDAFSNQILAVQDLTALGLICIIFYFFSSSMSDFASELTGGPNMKGVTVSAFIVVGAIADKAKEGYNRAKAAASKAKDGGKGGEAAKDSGGGGASRAGDRASGGGGRASDSGGGG